MLFQRKEMSVIFAACVTISGVALWLAVTSGIGVGQQPEPARGQSSSQPCPDCPTKSPYEVRLSGIPEIDNEILRENSRKLAEANRQRLEQRRAVQLARRDAWHGTEVTVFQYRDEDAGMYALAQRENPAHKPPPRLTPAQLKELEDVAAVFATDLPSPPERTKAFSKYLAPNARVKVVGWEMCIMSATDVKDGKLVSVNVGSQAVSPTGGAAFVVGLGTKEVWHLGFDGSATPISVAATGTDGMAVIP